MTPQLKICGLMRDRDVELCCSMGVDICGFVTEYPLDVPWNLSKEDCRYLLAGVAPSTKSCIVTGGAPEQILALTLDLRPDLVPLHFHETLADTAALVQALAPYEIRVIKTIPTSPDERRGQFGAGSLEDCVRALCGIGVYGVLADSRGPDNAAQGGALDLGFSQRVCAVSTCPVAIGGGITADNCRTIVEAVRPAILDVMTGVEDAPGRKSGEKLAALLGVLHDRQP